VDDHDMAITHVIRGDDHLNNTPRQLNMLRAMVGEGGQVPVYAHLPMILGPDGTKLSKRHGAVSVLEYDRDGFLPEALLNYLARLGWSHGDQELFTLAELVELFDIEDVNKSASAINPDKLAWLNQQHMLLADNARLAAMLRPQLVAAGLEVPADADLVAIVACQKERSKTLREMATASRFFFEAPQAYEEKAAKKHLAAEGQAALQAVIGVLAGLPEWNGPAIHEAINALATTQSVGLGKLAQPVRVAVSGGSISPPIDATLAILGRAETLARLARAATAQV
jgi:glutamyl-tRNA synthetase